MQIERCSQIDADRSVQSNQIKTVEMAPAGPDYQDRLLKGDRSIKIAHDKSFKTDYSSKTNQDKLFKTDYSSKTNQDKLFKTDHSSKIAQDSLLRWIAQIRSTRLCHSRPIIQGSTLQNQVNTGRA